MGNLTFINYHFVAYSVEYTYIMTNRSINNEKNTSRDHCTLAWFNWMNTETPHAEPLASVKDALGQF